MAKLVFFYNRNRKALAFGSKYGVKITLDGSGLGTTVYDVPLLINSDFDTSLFNALCDPSSSTPCRSDAGDLRVLTDPYDDSTRQGIEIHYFVQSATPANRRLQIWLEAGSIPAGSTKDLYLVWGNSSNTQPARNATYGADQVWYQLPGGFAWDLACHMQGTTTMKDSSSFNHSITKPNYASHGPYESDTDIPFSDTHAQLFTGSNDSTLVIPGLASQLAGDICAMFWMRKPSANPPSGYERIVSNKDNFTDSTGFEITFVPGQQYQLRIIGVSGASSDINFTLPVYGGAEEWIHYAVMIGATGDTWAYQNGVYHGGSNIGTIGSTSRQVVIGNDSNRNESGFVGRLAEFRLHDGNFNSDLVNVMYDNMNNPGGLATVTFL